MAKPNHHGSGWIAIPRPFYTVCWVTPSSKSEAEEAVLFPNGGAGRDSISTPGTTDPFQISDTRHTITIRPGTIVVNVDQRGLLGCWAGDHLADVTRAEVSRVIIVTQTKNRRLKPRTRKLILERASARCIRNEDARTLGARRTHRPHGGPGP